MASPTATLLIDVVTDVAKVRRDLGQVAKEIQGFGKLADNLGNTFKGLVAGFGVERLIAFGEAIERNVDAMADMAENLKLGVGEFQALQNSAYLAGQSIENVGAALGKFNIFLGKAMEGGKEQIELLNSLGVSTLDAAGKERDRAAILQDVAKALTSMESPTRRAAAEVAIFGKSGQAVSAILNQWLKGTEALNEELQKMGLVHSPEVTKQLAELADRSDIARQQIEVLFAPFYAAAKAIVFDIVAAGLERVANAINSVRAGSAADITKVLAALAMAGTGNVLGAWATLGAVNNPLEVLDDQIAAATKQLQHYEDGLVQAKQAGDGMSKTVVEMANKVAVAQLALDDLKRKREAATRPAVYTGEGSTGGGGVRNPGVKGTGTDKFAEAIARMKIELEGSQKAIEEFNKRASMPSEAAKRYADMEAGIAKMTAKMIEGTDATGAQKKEIEDLARQIGETKFKYDDLVKTQENADKINEKYGDGTKQLADETYYLQKAFNEQRIGLVEYTAALEDLQRRAEEQRLIHAGLGEGLSQVAAGFQYAALQAQNANSSFAQGQQLFQTLFTGMSQAIEEFVTTGKLNFDSLAKSFGNMLARMAAEWAAKQFLTLLLGDPSGGLKPGEYGPPNPNAGGILGTLFGALFGGTRQHGGPVMPGYSYLVGERGPERFFPTPAGSIGPAGGGSTDVTVNVAMGTTQGATDPSRALDFGRKLQVAIKDVIMNEQRPGGTLYSRVT